MKSLKLLYQVDTVIENVFVQQLPLHWMASGGYYDKCAVIQSVPGSMDRVCYYRDDNKLFIFLCLLGSFTCQVVVVVLHPSKAMLRIFPSYWWYIRHDDDDDDDGRMMGYSRP